MVKINLKYLLENKGLTQAEVSRMTGIRPSTICDMYNNNCAFLKIDHIQKICNTLECTIEELLILVP